MKDFDFDELDRAVSSVMGGKNDPDELVAVKKPLDNQSNTANIPPAPPSTVPSAASSPELPVTPPPARDDTANSAPMPTPIKPAVNAALSPAPQPAAKPASAARRGRFMDVVRPGVAQSPQPTRMNRQGMTIEPTGPLMTDVVPGGSYRPSNDQSATAPAQDSSAVQDTTTSPAANPEPAPAKSVDDQVTYSPLSSSPKLLDAPDQEALLDAALADAQSNDEEPLESPFLPGTKVEKRPLGGSTSPAPSADQPPIVPPAPADAQLTPNPSDVAPTPLPEELSSDVMALESDANIAKSESTTTPDPVAEQPEPKRPVSSVEPIVPKGPISIPQQYREAPSTGATDNGAIYDTDTYHHQPLAHPKKKKSGWLWVVWIILILVLGAASGAALYYFNIL